MSSAMGKIQWSNLFFSTIIILVKIDWFLLLKFQLLSDFINEARNPFFLKYKKLEDRAVVVLMFKLGRF